MDRLISCVTHYWPMVLIAGAVLCALGTCSTSLASHEAAETHHSEAEAGEAEHSGPESGGIALGEYRIRSDYPAEAQKSTVRFVLYASVKEDKHSEMSHLAAEHRQKVRDEVITATRLTPLSTFEEPDLAGFRRRILVRLRRTIPEFEIEDLYISDFSLMVKSL